jgi:hypothetical protein
MNQIAIGDTSFWTIIHGASVAAPFLRASYVSFPCSDQQVDDKIELYLEGTPSQISAALALLENVISRSILHTQGGYPFPQMLRFQPEPEGSYFYCHLSNPYLSFNPSGYTTHHTGSLQVTLHFTRPNWFDSDQIELPLTNRNGEDVTGGIPLFNHTDAHAGHDSSVLIKPGDIDSALPAPLRFELENTYGTDEVQDVFAGLYHHPANEDHDIFFWHAPDFMGGSLLYSPDAINEYFRRLNWSGTSLTDLGSWTFTNAAVQLFSGRAYRPILHLPNPHAYADLYLKVKLLKGSLVLCEGDAIYADPSFQYLIFPPVRIPPVALLNENLPHHIDFAIFAQRQTSGTHQLDVDNLHLLPLDTSATFLGFFTLMQDAVLIDDCFLGKHNIRYPTLGSEAVGHLRQGGPLFLYPGAYNRLFFVQSNTSHQVDILRTATLKVYYRKRIRLL